MTLPHQMAWVGELDGEFEYADPFARYTEVVGLTIKSVHMGGDPEGLSIVFEEGRTLRIEDGGQSCCESRYMTCDDDLSGHEGGQLVFINSDAGGPTPQEEDDRYGNCHEVQFIKVQTTKGSLTLCTHNEHNGYYGGFGLRLKLIR